MLRAWPTRRALRPAQKSPPRTGPQTSAPSDLEAAWPNSTPMGPRRHGTCRHSPRASPTEHPGFDGGHAGPSVSVSTNDYSYSISSAVGLCEGVITGLDRVRGRRHLDGSQPVHDAATSALEYRIAETGEQRVHRQQCRIPSSEDVSLLEFRIPYWKFARHFRGMATSRKSL